MTDQSTTERVTYAKNDTIETLSAKQLELITKTQCDVLLTIIEDTTYFDVHRLRLMLELGAIEAGRRLDAMTAGTTERIAELERKNAELVKDATRWRALISSARIRPLGCAGIRKPEADNYAHLGLELWTVFGRDLNDEQRERLAKENALGREWLTSYADIAAAASHQKEDKAP